MPDPRADAHPIALDESTLEIWGLQGLGKSVKLVGEVDDLWADSFTQAQHAHRDARFYLDRRRRVLVFSAETGEDPQRILAEARALLDLANRCAGREAPQKPLDATKSGADEKAPRSTASRVSSRVARMENTRGSSRVGASLMVEFCAGGNVASAMTGMTRDLSESGVFILTNRLPSVGERLNLRFHLAAQKRIDLTGEVVRVLDRDEARRIQLRPGFAARVTDPAGYHSLQVLVRGQV
jgi:hypothetical protein